MSSSKTQVSLLDLEFPVEVWLASEDVSLGQLLDLEPGEVLSLAKDPDAEVDLVVNGTTVACGELIVMEGSFGFRVTSTAAAGLADIQSKEPGDEDLDAPIEAALGQGEASQQAPDQAEPEATTEDKT